MGQVFLSHSSKDDAFVRELRQALELHGVSAWIDSRELLPGGLLDPDIKKAIEESDAYAVVVSLASHESVWVGKELMHALGVQKQRGRGKFPVIPLSLDERKLGVLEAFFEAEPIYIPVSSKAGGVERAINPILVALGVRKPADVEPSPQPPAQPVEELALELTDLKFHEQEGVRRASARARLVYEPAEAGQPEVASAQAWRLIAPLGPIETEELRWYLEKFAIWPSEYFRERARKVEQNLVAWGRLLHDAALPVAHTANVLAAWKVAQTSGWPSHTAGETAARAPAVFRFSIHVDASLEAGAPEADVNNAREAATLLLGLPWELLHDGGAFLFQGAKPTRVRRRLPNTRVLDVPVVATPIRILLVTARPEDDVCGYIDHRASALPLVEAMEELGGLVRLHILSPPTLPALREELDRARRAGAAYHVVHFDGHGVFDRTAGLGGLCFEEPQDISQLERRRHATVFTDELGALLRDHRVPLVFLEACQTAMSEKASESVATKLLSEGVASVVAMSHSVLVETARRFVESFYQALARGARVGDAMLDGQRRLKDDTFRARVFGVGELRLEDWFVPVLFQEKDDPQLFRETPARQTRDDFLTALKVRLGDVPPTPATGFIGRSRDLLALQRLLRGTGVPPVGPAGVPPAAPRYAVIRGQGGEGKTALAAEFARWMVRSHQIRRAAFVSVETHGNVLAVLDAIGRQLIGKNYSAAIAGSSTLGSSTGFQPVGPVGVPPAESANSRQDARLPHSQDGCATWEAAIIPIERALREQSTLLVVDNMESILLPPFVESETPEALTDDAREELNAILKICARLLAVGDTRLVFTSREALPAPFDADRHRRELHRLDREDAVKFVERVLNADEGSAAGAALEAARESIEELVDKVHGHARTLTLLASSLKSQGVEATSQALNQLMVDMDRQYPPGSPGSREKSVFASVELSLRRMSPANRDKARVLGVFHGGVQLGMLMVMMEWTEADVGSLATELVQRGLATPNRHNHLTLNPAFCPCLRGRMDAEEREALMARWVGAMRTYAGILVQQRSQNAELAATLTVLDLPNLFALLDIVQRAGDADATIDLATSLYSLLQMLGKPRLLERVKRVRDFTAAGLSSSWNHAQFEVARNRVEQQLDSRQLPEAFDGAQQLLQRARTAGEQAYLNADYDLAGACWILARVLKTLGDSGRALPLSEEARQRFEAFAKARPGAGAERMVSASITEKGDCFGDLGRLDEAAAAYEDAIRYDEKVGADRGVAVGRGQLGTVRMEQRRYPEALAAYTEARTRFTQLGEPGTVAVFWHQIGMLYRETAQAEAAEDAYREALAIEVRLGNVAGQAKTLNQLGLLYHDLLGRTEEAVAFFRQAADMHGQNRDLANEGGARNNLALHLRKLRRLDEAREEVRRAIECKARFGRAAQPWTAWSILADIEMDAGNLNAAADAKCKATAGYLAYRRDGGENHETVGRISLTVTQTLLAGDQATARSLLEQLAARPDANASFQEYFRALQAIVAGSRDHTLADAHEFDFGMAAEILLLLETLEKAEG